ncbi:SDR family NAD(P)-dependent oxidoreductase [Marinomonas agarivorans]|nr:SDR family NAD(P)-dependent oxidoreductase [Marinomonas agarivorans]
MHNIAIIIGAAGGISQAIIRQLLNANEGQGQGQGQGQRSSIDHIFAVSRAPLSTMQPTIESDHLTWLLSDYSENSIDTCCEVMADYLRKQQARVTKIIIANGILQTETIRPERALKQLSAQNLHEVFHANTVIPALWLAALAPLIEKRCSNQTAQACIISVLSARVGSIGDNSLGGWHSYRASKAALNMILKGAAIELERSKKHARLIAFHPGTTDTALSKPFQASVPSDKLFQPEFVADRLLTIMAEIATDPSAKTLQFLDWDRQTITW